MRNTIEHPLPLGLIMSLDEPEINCNNKLPLTMPIKTEDSERVDETGEYEHIWINGEFSWKL